MSNGVRYRLAHERFVALIGEVDDAARITATPAWTAKELLAHLTGVCADLVAGNVEEWSAAQWTAVQVAARAGRPRDELLQEWAALLPQACAIVDDPVALGFEPVFGRVPLIDLLVHTDDLRECVGVDGAIQPDDWAIVAPHRRMLLDLLVREHEVPALRVLTLEGDDWAVGGDVADHEVHLPRQELWRSLTGRRSRAAVCAYGWNTDPTPYLPAWVSSSFGWPAD